jgi:hypothetical protein
MNNPFHEIEQLLQNDSIASQDAIRALLATIYLECCEQCGARMRSTEFLLAVQRMAKELQLCRRLNTANAA